MGKYRLKLKGGKMPFTFMEIDTDCHAWYIHADSTEAAVRCLSDMAGELQGIDSFYVNGDDVTEKVADACLRIMHQRQQEASDIPLPEDEDYLGGGMDLSMPPLGEPADIPVVPTLDDIRKAESAAGPAPE